MFHDGSIKIFSVPAGRIKPWKKLDPGKRMGTVKVKR